MSKQQEYTASMTQKTKKGTRGKNLIKAARKYAKLEKRGARNRHLVRLSDKIERLALDLTNRVQAEREAIAPVEQ